MVWLLFVKASHCRLIYPKNTVAGLPPSGHEKVTAGISMGLANCYRLQRAFLNGRRRHFVSPHDIQAFSHLPSDLERREK